jgi:hypothetical protein
MASQDECVARFPGQQICVQRSYSRLLAWAAYTAALPPPPTDTAPDPAAVKQRITAERTPMQANVYSAQLGPFLMEEPLMTGRVREHLSEWNDEATETALSADIDTAFAAVMPRFAEAVVSDADATAWCDKHGYPSPVGAV